MIAVRHSPWFPIAALSAIAIGSLAASEAFAAESDLAPAYATQSLRGRIVWLDDALQRKHGIAVDPDAARTIVALETADGRLVPIVKDFRGRGFHVDPKLRELDWELLVRAFPGVPFVQVVRTYVWRDGKKYEFDYWCDVCAIPMYELKDCECCQGATRFRFREAKD